MKRRLTTILAADVVGYSRLMGADGAGTLSALKAVRTEVVDGRSASTVGELLSKPSRCSDPHVNRFDKSGGPELMHWARHDSDLDGLRGDPRLQKFLESISTD